MPPKTTLAIEVIDYPHPLFSTTSVVEQRYDSCILFPSRIADTPNKCLVAELLPRYHRLFIKQVTMKTETVVEFFIR